MGRYKDIKTCDVNIFVLPNRAYAGSVYLRYALYCIIANVVANSLVVNLVGFI